MYHFRKAIHDRIGLSRVGRARLGATLIIVDLGLIVLDTLNGEKVSVADAMLHLGLLAAGLSLIDSRLKLAELMPRFRK